MPINVPNKGTLDGRIGQVSVELRESMRAVSDLYTTLTQIGATELQAIGYTADDVAALATTFGAIAALATAYQGGAYTGPALPYDFLHSTAAWWNGQ